nr:hypothetical protein [Desulfosudis oleivorans]
MDATEPGYFMKYPGWGKSRQAIVATNGLNDVIELLEKPRPVTLVQRRRASGDLSGPPEFREKIPGSDSLADIAFRKWFPRRPDNTCAFFDAAARKKNIGGYNNIERFYVLDNPIIRRIKGIPNNFERYSGLSRDPHKSVRYQRDVKITPARHAIHLLFHRAGICINKNM